MEIVTIRTAKATLSQLLARVEAGEEILLARDARPIAKLVPLRPARKRRRFGALRGKVTIGPKFSEPPREQELEQWE
jgi:prevent-host-death family protein